MSAILSEPVLRWPLNVDAVMQSTYATGDDQLDRLYQKAKAQQWNADDYDWSYELNPDNPLDMPDGTLLIFGSPLWQKMDEPARAEVRHHFHAWTLSQILHGEQGAMLCAIKLAQGEEHLSARLCACAQAFDEARHIEVYSRLVNDKLRVTYPMSSSLKRLLEDTITSRQLDITNLGMQVLVEGIALSIFQNIVAYSRDSFIKEVVTRIQRDEARHFAVGRVTLRRLYNGELSAAEMREREEFTCEGIHVLYEHLCADDIWEQLGQNRKECGELVRNSKMANALRRNLFRRLVPSLKDMGLLNGKVVTQLEKMDMLDYAELPLRVEA
ncbi:ferritin-like domain-containing protein [Tahibacter amnicola]|uniref:Ferritin-like domain-containing protein n=1 Tax=Tahibacter amnicola TaxID=2976241 RepID=A0ABY6B7Y5_9GAMM|nr:ferritin-like domain-containing protein [Tahibacter amnicola]UXI66201.1 ferritin-like domain-containing protein [Tahibacter amnicola]